MTLTFSHEERNYTMLNLGWYALDGTFYVIRTFHGGFVNQRPKAVEILKLLRSQAPTEPLAERALEWLEPKLVVARLTDQDVDHVSYVY
jgi:hypothetical protein